MTQRAKREESALWHLTMTLFIRATSPDEWEQLKRIIVVVITILIVVVLVVVVVYIQCSLDKILYDIGST
jgi:flagellar biosynthesis/type III secretory pathway M-ring protein FliF/YscJ